MLNFCLFIRRIQNQLVIYHNGTWIVTLPSPIQVNLFTCNTIGQNIPGEKFAKNPQKIRTRAVLSQQFVSYQNYYSLITMMGNI